MKLPREEAGALTLLEAAEAASTCLQSWARESRAVVRVAEVREEVKEEMPLAPPRSLGN